MNRVRNRLGPLQIGIVVLGVAAALIHLALALPSEWPFNVLFALNGVGYLALLAALYLELPFAASRRGWVRMALIVYTLVTIALFFLLNDTYGTFGLITKGIEALLVLLLVLEKPERL